MSALRTKLATRRARARALNDLYAALDSPSRLDRADNR